MSAANEVSHRLTPPLWATDWLLLRGLAHTLRHMVAQTEVGWGDVVDFGCGAMPYRPLFEQAGARYVGADFGPGAAIQITADGRLPLPDASADAVVSFQVLEHVADLNTYFAEIRRVLRDDGLLLLSTHGTWLYHPHPEDHRRWTRTGLVLDITTRGFETTEMHSLIGPLATTTIFRSTGFAFFLRRLPIFGATLASVLTMIMNLRAWLEDQLTPASIRRDNACVYLTRCVKKLA